MPEVLSLLSDDEIMAEAEIVAEEIAAGEGIHLADLAARFGITVEDALALASEFATEKHGRPIRFVLDTDFN